MSLHCPKAPAIQHHDQEGVPVTMDLGVVQQATALPAQVEVTITTGLVEVLPVTPHPALVEATITTAAKLRYC